MIYAYGNRTADWTAAAVWILAEFSLFHYFEAKMPKRLEDRRKAWAVWGVWWGLLTGVQIRQVSMSFLSNYLLRLVLLTFYTVAVNQATFLLAGYVTFIFYLVKDICKMVLLDVLCPAFHVPVAEDPWLNAGSMALCAAMQFLILRQTGHIIRMDRQMYLRKADLAIIFFPVVPYALIKYLQVSSYTYGKEQDFSFSVVCLMLCICDLVIFLQAEYQITAQRIREEAEALRVRTQAQQEWYCQEQAKIQEVHKIYHDMKHHLSYIGSLSDNGKIREYISSIAGDMAPCERFRPTGNEVIDSVLAKYGTQCAASGVRLIPTVNGQVFGFMEPKDLLVILGNALDNAWEAVSHVEQEEKREIVLRVDARQNFGIIRVENHFSGQVAFDRSGAVKTTKRDAGRHGYGIKNIQSAARKYGGEASIETENGMFILTVAVPVRGRECKRDVLWMDDAR